MITGGMVAVITRRMIHITDNVLVLVCFVDMAIKRPHRPVTEGAYDEPEHEKALEHDLETNWNRMDSRDRPGDCQSQQEC